MAYGAIVSLKQTAERLLSYQYPHLLPREVVQNVHEHGIVYAKNFLELNLTLENNNDWEYSLAGEMIEAIYRLEDVLEFHVSDLFLSDSDGNSRGGSSNLEQVETEMRSFFSKVEKIREEHKAKWAAMKDAESTNGLKDDAIPSGWVMKEMVGMDDEFRRLTSRLLSRESSRIISILGTAGIGKTTLAKRVYDSPDIIRHFDLRAFIKVGLEYYPKPILERLLVSIDPNFCITNDQCVDNLLDCLKAKIVGKSCLIVFDDLWSSGALNTIDSVLSKIGNGSRILLTTRLEEVAAGLSPHYIRFLNKEESWNLLRKVVFVGESSCPNELERLGKQIAENCEGLPLAIIAVGKVLSGKDKTRDYWKKVAESQDLMVVRPEDEEYISKILLPSFTQLPTGLKACFLYMGVFPKMKNIRSSKFIKLWASEGFLQRYLAKNFEDVADECLEKLVSCNLVLVCERGSFRRIKTCSVHYAYRRLCITQAEKLKFLHRMYKYNGSSPDDLLSKRRLCIHNNALFGVKDVFKLVESTSSIRSLLCLGPYHPYPVQIPISNLRLLRQLDILTIRFYQFPMEVLKLVLLRYLAFTSSGGQIPVFISKLHNLEYLIVLPYLCIVSCGKGPSSLPKGIWDMKQLRHIQVVGTDVGAPSNEVRNLITLSGVSAHSCTKDLLCKLVNLRKLAVQIVLFWDVEQTLHVFDHLALLFKLESFKCTVTNPNTSSKFRFPPQEKIFPSSLKKLSLSGCGFAWEDMKLIGKLENLQVLKLRCYAVQSPVWIVDANEFQRLEYLLLEDLDLELWIMADGASFRVLQLLIIKNCYKLKCIPVSVPTVELVDCNRSVEKAARLFRNPRNVVNAHYSWIKSTGTSNEKDSSSLDDEDEALPDLDGTSSCSSPTISNEDPKSGRQISCPYVSAWGILEEACFIRILLEKRTVAPLNNSERIEMTLKAVAGQLSNHFNRIFNVDQLQWKFYALQDRYKVCSMVLREPGVLYDPLTNTVDVPYDVRIKLFEEDSNTARYFEEAEEQLWALYNIFHDAERSDCQDELKSIIPTVAENHIQPAIRNAYEAASTTIFAVDKLLTTEGFFMIKVKMEIADISQRPYSVKCNNCNGRSPSSVSINNSYLCSHCNKKSVAIVTLKISVVISDDSGNLDAFACGTCAETLIRVDSMTCMLSYDKGKESYMLDINDRLSCDEFTIILSKKICQSMDFDYEIIDILGSFSLLFGYTGMNTQSAAEIQPTADNVEGCRFHI